jgi:hypothetical protein
VEPQAPVEVLQVATWHTPAEAEQSLAAPAKQVPVAEHRSLPPAPVQALPSLQGVLTGAFDRAQRPVVGTQALVWQATVEAEQVTDVFATQAPALQLAAVTQRLEAWAVAVQSVPSG